MNQKIISLLIIGFLLSGCVDDMGNGERTYQLNSDTHTVPIYNNTLILRTDGTFMLNSNALYHFGYQDNSSESGLYTETDLSIVLSEMIVLTKDGMNLTDNGRGIYVRQQ